MEADLLKGSKATHHWQSPVSRDSLRVSSSVAPSLSWLNLSSTQVFRTSSLGEGVARISAQQTFEELGVLHSGYKGKDGRSRVKFGRQSASIPHSAVGQQVPVGAHLGVKPRGQEGLIGE